MAQKYNIDEFVWGMCGLYAKDARVIRIEKESEKIQYMLLWREDGHVSYRDEFELFPSKQELIKAICLLNRS